MREEDTVCVGSDGLQYCKVCGEAKEAFFPKGDFMGMKKHSRQCACDRKAYEEEQKYFKDKGLFFWFLSPRFSKLLCMQYCIRRKSLFQEACSVNVAYNLMLKGIKEYKKGCY